MNRLFRFVRNGQDVIDTKSNKVTSYKEVNVVAKSEQLAREKAKLTDEYGLTNTFTLNKDWL